MSYNIAVNTYKGCGLKIPNLFCDGVKKGPEEIFINPKSYTEHFIKKQAYMVINSSFKLDINLLSKAIMCSKNYLISTQPISCFLHNHLPGILVI